MQIKTSYNLFCSGGSPISAPETLRRQGAALGRNGVPVSTEIGCRFEPKSRAENSEICSFEGETARAGTKSADDPAQIEQKGDEPRQRRDEGLHTFSV